MCKEVREHNLVRREHAATRLAAVTPLALPPLLPSFRCLGDVVMGVLRTTLAAKARPHKTKHCSWLQQKEPDDKDR